MKRLARVFLRFCFLFLGMTVVSALAKYFGDTGWGQGYWAGVFVALLTPWMAKPLDEKQEIPHASETVNG